MADHTEQKWYVRIENFDLGAAHCPRCGVPYTVGPVFDHDPHPCLNCGATLVEWNLMNPIFIIDRDRAPEILKSIMDYLALLTEQQANIALYELFSFLGVIKY